MARVKLETRSPNEFPHDNTVRPRSPFGIEKMILMDKRAATNSQDVWYKQIMHIPKTYITLKK